ncbi:DNA integration/recombination/inversion protein, partial [Streptococcus sp. SPC0]|nr:DNA integration/recombination/inversion protein [Streptococcus sp. SPC0]
MIDVENILEKMKPNQKINYDWVMQQMVKQWQASDIRPKILMHVC